MGAAISGGIVALVVVIGAVNCDAPDLLVCRDLAEQDGCATDVAPCHLDSSDLECLLIDPEVDPAPDPPLGATMLARVRLAFALNLDPGAVDQLVQQALDPAIRDVYRHGLQLT
jgi:hypothetical protein